ncbi:MAG: energy-coupling factor transporter transmembrane component T [Bacillota bacterium]
MDIALIDAISQGQVGQPGVWHGQGATAKALFLLGVVVGALAARNLYAQAIVAYLVAASWYLARPPWRQVLPLLVYPLLLSVAFVSLRFGLSSPAAWALILRGISLAAGIILVLLTTPYPQVFGLLQLFLPAVVVDCLVLCYRYFFYLSASLAGLFAALRLRAGWRRGRPGHNVAGLARVLGSFFLATYDSAERLHQAMELRGYRPGRLAPGVWVGISRRDWPALVLGLGAGLAGIIL